MPHPLLPGYAPRKAPRRRFGIFRLPSEVRYTSEEETVRYVQRSLWVLVAREALPVGVSLLVLLVTFLVPATGSISGGLWVLWQNLLYFAVPFLALWIIVVWLNYADDVYILTNKRMIDIERSYWLFAERRIEIEYKNIKDIKLKMPGIIGILLDIGHVSVETPGTNPDITFSYVDEPLELQNEIYKIKRHQEEVEKVKKENEQKELLHRWLATVLTGLESVVETRGIPDLKGKDLSTAIAIAQLYEMDVVINPAVLETTEVPPGCVCVQNPPRGTVMRRGSKIEVMLGKKPALP